MDEVCRLCLHLEANMTSIFYGNNETSELQLKIQDLCSVEISENDALPKMICNNCKEKLSSVEEFRKQCKHSDLKLREHYQISTSSRRFYSLFRVLQDVGVQTESNIEDSTFSKHSIITIEKRQLWPVDADDDMDRYKKCDSVINELGLIDKYKSDGDEEQQNDVNLKKRLKSQLETDITMNKKRLKTIKNKEKFKCHLCQKVYVSKKSLLKHTEAHMKEEIVMCKVCNKAFNNSDKLAEHIRKHSDGMDFKCEVCGMPFKEQVKLNFHLRVHGKGPPVNTDKQYLCDMCSRTFASKSGLRFHLKSHTGTKPYTCKFCNKSFTIPSYKKRHERTHTGDKHFICHICSAGFASANGLKYHLRSHTGEANYHCSTCGKSFRRLKYLKEHTFTHTGERPFICKICGSAYGNSGSLFVHEKKCKTQYALGIIATSKIQANAEVQNI